MANRYRIFIDESNTPEYWDIHKHGNEERFYTLCAVIIEGKEYRRIKRELKAIFEKYSKYLGDNELKSRYIRHGNPKNEKASESPYLFWNFGDQGLRDYIQFAEELKALFKEAKLEIISVTCDKHFAQSKYPTFDIATTVFSDLWERIAIYHAVNKITCSRVMLDSRYDLSDTATSTLYSNLNSNGSIYVTRDRMKKVGIALHKNIFFLNSKDSRGLQICDYFAYPIQKSKWNNRNDGIYNEVVVPKLSKPIKDVKTGKTIQMGDKMSLSR